MIIKANSTTGAFEFEDTNYSGHKFSDFFVCKDAARGPGWYVYGRNADKYGTNSEGLGNYVKVVAQPNVPLRRHPHYNGMVKRGWRTKREAETVARFLNTEQSR